jgi:D-methionine transport system substrate-binding protein
MLNQVVEPLAAQGYRLEIIEFTDYVTPNEALFSGEIDANFFQHLPYMETFNTEHSMDLVSAGGIHIEPLALYSNKYKATSELPAGAKIAIPNDATNGGRALLLLQSGGLITLDPASGITATVHDIVDNPHNLEFAEIEAASLTRVLQDVDAAVINGNYAIDAGLNALKDGLLIESADSPYVNIISVKAGQENSEKIQALVNALCSDVIADFIGAKYPNGEVVAVF